MEYVRNCRGKNNEKAIKILQCMPWDLLEPRLFQFLYFPDIIIFRYNVDESMRFFI